MSRRWRWGLVVLALPAGLAGAQSWRGELLYSTYCHTCHTEKVHWRDKKLVTDWDSLLAEVRRWQVNGKLDWDRYDVEAVARYLNHLHYHYPGEDR